MLLYMSVCHYNHLISAQPLDEPSVQWWLLMVHQEPAQISFQGWILQTFPLKEEAASIRTLGGGLWDLNMLSWKSACQTSYDIWRDLWHCWPQGRCLQLLLITVFTSSLDIRWYAWQHIPATNDSQVHSTMHPFSAITPATRLSCCTCREHQTKTSQINLLCFRHLIDLIKKVPETHNRDFADSTCHETFDNYW